MQEKKIRIKTMIKEWLRQDYITPEDVPSIELYMDQVTTFMDKQLENTKRFDSDKTLTKTMINNYTKNNLLPPPLKKKYSKEHIFLLIYIYYFKNFLTISDIQKILDPMIENFCKDGSALSMEEIYHKIFDTEHTYFKTVLENVDAAHNLSKRVFQDYDGEEKDYLDQFSFLSLLAYDVYLKKRLMEHIIDTMLPEKEVNEDKKEKPSKEKKASKKTES